MNIAPTQQFDYDFRAATLVDIGKQRSSNQDEIMAYPELGFFAVSDGMGGLAGGRIASEFVGKAMPKLMEIGVSEFLEHGSVEKASVTFRETVRMLSDNLYEAGNTPGHFTYGATFVGVWLLRDKAVFVCLGDSRGYLLSKYKKTPCQITEDQNIAGILVNRGVLTKSEANNHPSSSVLTAFVGMPIPAEPQLYVVEIHPGDRILLCSDGLYSMVEETEIARIMRSSCSPEIVCQRLIDRANENGGLDNISAAYIKIN